MNGLFDLQAELIAGAVVAAIATGFANGFAIESGHLRDRWFGANAGATAFEILIGHTRRRPEAGIRTGATRDAFFGGPVEADTSAVTASVDYSASQKLRIVCANALILLTL